MYHIFLKQVVGTQNFSVWFHITLAGERALDDEDRASVFCNCSCDSQIKLLLIGNPTKNYLKIILRNLQFLQILYRNLQKFC